MGLGICRTSACGCLGNSSPFPFPFLLSPPCNDSNAYTMTLFSSLSGRSRVFAHLVLVAVFLLLAYQLVLRGSVQSIPLDADNADLDRGISRHQPIHPVSRELVFAAMRHSNMSWVNETLPQWPANIYRADISPGQADLTVPVNRGNEAMVYLTCAFPPGSSLWSVRSNLEGDTTATSSIATGRSRISASLCTAAATSGTTITLCMTRRFPSGTSTPITSEKRAT